MRDYLEELLDLLTQEDEEAAQAPAEEVVYSTEAPAQEEEPAAEEQE